MSANTQGDEWGLQLTACLFGTSIIHIYVSEVLPQRCAALLILSNIRNGALAVIQTQIHYFSPAGIARAVITVIFVIGFYFTRLCFRVGDSSKIIGYLVQQV